MGNIEGSSPTSPPLYGGHGAKAMALLSQLEPKHHLDIPTRRVDRGWQDAEFGLELHVGRDLERSAPITDTEAHHLINNILRSRAVNEQNSKPRQQAKSEWDIRNEILARHKWDRYFSVRVRHETVEDAVEAEKCCAAAGLSKLEGAYLTSLGCETAEEARTLVGPLESADKVSDGELQNLVDVLKSLRQKLGTGPESL